MKSNKSLALLFLVLVAGSVMAQSPSCPSVEQIRNIQFVNAVKNYDGDWAVRSAPFKVNNANWKVSLVYYSRAQNPYWVLLSVQNIWKNAVLGGPFSQTECYYGEASDPSEFNWISAHIVL
jgi:hypothetical protein